MPNWCEVDVRLNGKTEDKASLLEFMGVNEDPPQFDIGRLMPYPSVFKQRDDERPAHGAPKEQRDAFVAKWGNKNDGYNSGGYEWCRDNWGAKWPPSDVVKTSFGVSFQTPWTHPAIAIFAELHKRFPTIAIHVEYFECGMSFCGGFSFETEEYHDEENGKWEAGTVSSRWHSNEYRGTRGG